MNAYSDQRADVRPGRPFPFPFPVLALATMAAALAAPAAAQAPPDTLRRDTVYEIEPIGVRAVRPSTTTGGVSAVVLRLDSIRMRPAPLLEDVLREIPLVQVRSNSRGEAQLALRGADERQVAILLDGVPLTLGWDHRTDLSVVPLTAAQRITLVRGLRRRDRAHRRLARISAPLMVPNPATRRDRPRSAPSSPPPTRTWRAPA